MAVVVVDVEREREDRSVRSALGEGVRVQEFEGRDDDEAGSRGDVKWGGERQRRPWQSTRTASSSRHWCPSQNFDGPVWCAG